MSMSLNGIGLDSSSEAKARFEGEGLAVIFPGPTELQIDLDSEEGYLQFLRLFEAFVRNSKKKFEIVREVPSRSGLPKRHITIETGEVLTAESRIAYQAILGSDPMRECLCMCRSIQGDPTPTLFVEAKSFGQNR